jgi:hypothetical protein
MAGKSSRVVHVPCGVERDEDGAWCAAARLRPRVGAVGDGGSRDEAVADLRDALVVLIGEVGASPELVIAAGEY